LKVLSQKFKKKTGQPADQMQGGAGQPAMCGPYAGWACPHCHP